MKAQDYKNFQQFERHLQSAKNTNYVRFAAGDLKVFSEYVQQWRGTPLTRQEQSCPHCFLQVCKKVAEEYFKYQNSPRGRQMTKEEGNGENESVAEE